MRDLCVVRAGTIGYEEALRLQRSLAAARGVGELPDVLLLLEHPPVYTKGRRADPAELPMGEDWYRRQGIEVVDTDRGGAVTYHGPGQLVAYPIMSLREMKSTRLGAGGREAEEAAGMAVHEYVALMERAMIGAVGEWGVQARPIDGFTGVWVGDPEPPVGKARKIGSIGIHISRGITTHGLAVNVNNDLQPFEWVVPCGIEACRMTSLARELGGEQDLDAFASTLAQRLADVYDRRPVETPAGELLGPLALEAA